MASFESWRLALDVALSLKGKKKKTGTAEEFPPHSEQLLTLRGSEAAHFVIAILSFQKINPGKLRITPNTPPKRNSRDW